MCIINSPVSRGKALFNPLLWAEPSRPRISDITAELFSALSDIWLRVHLHVGCSLHTHRFLGRLQQQCFSANIDFWLLQRCDDMDIICFIPRNWKKGREEQKHLFRRAKTQLRSKMKWKTPPLPPSLEACADQTSFMFFCTLKNFVCLTNRLFHLVYLEFTLQPWKTNLIPKRFKQTSLGFCFQVVYAEVCETGAQDQNPA